MLDFLGGVPRRLDVGFVPAPSGGQMYFWQEEEVRTCYLVIAGYAPDLNSPTRVETPALITGTGYVQSVFGYPNEDAAWKDPRGRIDHGCYEIEDSRWEHNIQEYNRLSVGVDYPFPGELHHYFIASKDGSCQLLARSLGVEVFPEMTFRQVIEESLGRERAAQTESMRQLQEMIDRNANRG